LNIDTTSVSSSTNRIFLDPIVLLLLQLVVKQQHPSGLSDFKLIEL
jgi:hypothetical protein